MYEAVKPRRLPELKKPLDEATLNADESKGVHGVHRGLDSGGRRDARSRPGWTDCCLE